MRHARRLLMAAFVATVPFAAEGGTIEGTVRSTIEGASLEDVRPLVVHLEPLDAPSVPPKDDVPVMRQSGAQFSPSLLVVTAGQEVEMRNDDEIYHNVFSYSVPNDFDLGVYAHGESRTVDLAHSGLVQIFCSIHESMNATVLVAASPHHVLVPGSGRFRISGVPAGKYRLHLWSPVLPAWSDTIRVPADGTVQTAVTVGEQNDETP